MKRIILTCSDEKRWSVEFEGLILRKDINKIPRLLQVSFGNIQRRRSRDYLIKNRTITPTVTTSKESPNASSNDSLPNTTPNALDVIKRTDPSNLS